jgi:hypothetical protein
MSDPVEVAARAAAALLAAEAGPGVIAEVDAALHARRHAERPEQFVDLFSLGSFIVAVATLAWMIYADLRKKTPEPRPAEVERQVLIELREQGVAGRKDAQRITAIAVTETLRAASEISDDAG